MRVHAIAVNHRARVTQPGLSPSLFCPPGYKTDFETLPNHQRLVAPKSGRCRFLKSPRCRKPWLEFEKIPTNPTCRTPTSGRHRFSDLKTGSDIRATSGRLRLSSKKPVPTSGRHRDSFDSRARNRFRHQGDIGTASTLEHETGSDIGTASAFRA